MKAKLFTFFIILLFSVISAQITSTTTGGNWKETSTWEGGKVPAKTDNVIIKGPVTITNGSYSSTTCYTKDLTINSSGSITGNAWLEIHGNFTNNGTIDNYITSIYGNIQNNGKVLGTNLTLKGKKQTIGATQKFENKSITFQSADTVVTATSDLEFHNVELTTSLYNRNTLDMKSYNIKISSDNVEYSGYYGRFTTPGKINSLRILFDTRTKITANKVTFSAVILEGDIILDGDDIIFSGVNSSKSQINGKLEITKNTSVNSYKYNNGFYINGDFINYGEIGSDSVLIDSKYVKHNPSSIFVDGNASNFGKIENGYFTIYAQDKERTIFGTYSSQIIAAYNENNTPSTGKIIVPDKLDAKFFSNGQIKLLCPMEIQSGATVTTDGFYAPFTIWNYGDYKGKLINKGIYNCIKDIRRSNDYNFTYGEIYLKPDFGFDTISVKTYGNQTPETFGNSVKRYWKITPNKKGNFTTSYLKLFYDESDLGSNIEKDLEVFHSADSGKSWVQISTSQNLTVDTDNNKVTIRNVPISGLYCISSNKDAYSIRPSIITSITGRDNFRVGPPNTYTINYVNNSNTPSNEVILMVAANGPGIFIDSVQPSVPEGAPQISIPVDSLTYDGKKDTVYLMISNLAPYEERSFSVTFSGNTEGMGLGKPGSENDTKVLPFLAVAAGYAAKTLIVAYVADVSLQFAEEVWRPVAKCETVGEAFKQAVKDSFTKTNKDWFCWEKPVKVIGENVKDQLQDKLGAGIPGKTFLDATEKTLKGCNRYLNDDFKVKDCSGKERSINGEGYESKKGIKKVTSWDPNEKAGPEGYGSEGHVATIGRMHYTIFFENKKEATAPAWKIVINDTLSEFLDPSTVEFGVTSHEGSKYKWTKSVNGNVVSWEIVDIELPPNVTPPEGEGWVKFSVMPKNNLPSGTAIKNKATIIFDVNKPITTNEVINTLDFEAPATTMTNLSSVTNENKLTVKWNSDDNTNGSGISTTTLYASENGGSYFSVGNTSENELTIDVNNGSSYSFYALSKDNVGNVETVIPRTVTTKVITSVSENEIPAVYELRQNYPNPFNPNTNIYFTLPELSEVKIIIYNILGQQVQILTDAIYPSGKHFVKWNAGNYASGVYFYKIKARSLNGNKNFSDVKKMSLIK